MNMGLVIASATVTELLLITKEFIKNSQRKFVRENRYTTLVGRLDLANIPNFYVSEVKEFPDKRLDNFKVRLIEQRDSFYPLLEQNFPSLEILPMTQKEIKQNKTTIAFYEADTNKVKYMEFYNKKHIDHELLHASVTCCNRKEGFLYSGFHQNVKYKSIYTNVFQYFNEGYTQLLCNRYLTPSDSYGRLVTITSFIEDIIGQYKMEDLYFNLDSKGLIDEVSSRLDFNETTILFNSIEDLGRKEYKERNIDFNAELLVISGLIAKMSKINSLVKHDVAEVLLSIFTSVKSGYIEYEDTELKNYLKEKYCDK